MLFRVTAKKKEIKIVDIKHDLYAVDERPTHKHKNNQNRPI